MRISANGINLRVVDEGTGETGAVLLLHGFPDSADLWRRQVGVLAQAGLRVVAPDLRGFGQSDRPDGVQAYRLQTALADVLGVLDTLGLERVRVVGHDWGAALAWVMAAFVPERVERLVALSVGHPNALWAANLRQRELSWYMLFFQFEGVAEEALRRDDWRLLRAWLRDHGDVERYVADLARPGALTAALNWYRANDPVEAIGGVVPALPPVACPTLGVWSTGDDYLTEEQVVGSAAHVTGLWTYERIDNSSHWIPLDAPERLNALLLDWLT